MGDSKAPPEGTLADPALFGATLVQAAGETRASWAPAPAASRYVVRDVLGSGGMGEVRVCEDRLIGREVAIKAIHADRRDDARAVSRFVREARIQGRLEHPSIVPVHDLGRTEDGGMFFTMKRIRGRTLGDVLERQRSGDADALSQYSPRKLLAQLVTVAWAVELAHDHGVLHRDLKPDNVMLGDFGEVYVLDWGIARPWRDAAPEPDTSPDGAYSSDTQTVTGALVGTPGYMSPEQVRGEPLDPRSDVYALGAILFEILALAPLHARTGNVLALLSATLTGVDARPSMRAPAREIDPELDALCVKATALDPSTRLASARELAVALERYLDGHRDTERRRELANEHATRAESLADRALAPGGGVDERAAALAEVGRALGLDAHHVAARRTLVRLLTAPPEVVPAEATAEIDASVARTQRTAGAVGAVAYSLWLLAIPLAFWMGITRMDLFVVFVVAQALALGSSLWAAFGIRRPRAVITFFATAAPLVATFTTHFMFGSLVMLPTLLAAVMTALLLNPRPLSRVAIVTVVVLMVTVPAALGALGVTQAHYAFDGGRMQIVPVMLQLPALPTLLSLVVASLLTIGTLALAVLRIRDDLSRAELRLQLLAWQLRQLVA